MMDVTFLDIFDQFRFVGGTICAELIFMVHTVPKKKHFILRSAVGVLCCFLLAMTYIPLYTFMPQIQVVSAFVVSAWWLLASVATVGFILFCYEVSLCNALFRCILGLALQQTITAVLRYCIVGMWFPEFPGDHPVWYVVTVLLIYTFFYTVFYQFLARRFQTSEELTFLNNRKMLSVYLILILAFSVLFDVTGGMFDWGRQLSAADDIGLLLWKALGYFCIGVTLVVCAVIFIIQYSIYTIAFLQQEKEILKRLQQEKEKQYEYSRENIDIINQKCHDLKRQLQALKLAGDDEREAMIEETKDAVEIYDSVVKTGNEVLNTILTEKSLICTRHGIRLSCTVSAEHLENMSVVDLYTMLSNALDNAIECVDCYREKEKKVISVMIQETGNMVCMSVDNYLEGKIELKNGLPVTSKKDKAYHGYGVKSIKMIAKKYGGDIRISTQNNTFSLQIIVPVVRKH